MDGATRTSIASLFTLTLLPAPALPAQQSTQQSTQQAARQAATEKTLTAETFAAWRRYIRPLEDERDWAKLPWLMTFHDGLEAAAKAQKPLLLWTMNGHPFGCT